MPFVKIVKNKSYFKRYQVKYRRRRQAKTDYRARRAMILQDKTKYGAPKYRLVVRRSNRDIVAQIITAKMDGDRVYCAAYAHELPAFGLSVGLTNYAAAYATGLLLARRTLTKLGIADKFDGVKDVKGDYFAHRDKNMDEDPTPEARFPFKAILDVGLARTTTGARIFGVLKGAVDGGIAVPHKPNRFPGFDKGKGELDAKKHRARIFGAHVAGYLKIVQGAKASNPDRRIHQFSQFEKAGLKPEKIEEMYKKTHAAIRANPNKKLEKKKRDAPVKKVDRSKPRKTKKQKKVDAKKKVESIRARMTKK